VSIDFPAIRPSSREYQPPAVPITETRSEVGSTFRRQRGSLPVDATLSLQFSTRPVADWLLIEAAWLNSRCGMEELILPPEVWAPDEAPTLPGLQWRFIPDQKPTRSQDHDLAGRVNIGVQLKAVAA
jgi:hypothetical protein